MSAKCKTCGAPVSLVPDGDPHYEYNKWVLRTEHADLTRDRERLEWLLDPNANRECKKYKRWWGCKTSLLGETTFSHDTFRAAIDDAMQRDGEGA